MRAAVIAAEMLGIEVATVVIGPGQEYEDLYGDWARLREIADSGVLLVRLDHHIAFRHAQAAPSGDADALLTAALRQILGHG